MLYLSIKCIHILAFVSWMVGLLYLPRLFIYHTKSEVGSVQSETFKIMERRLQKVIMSPAMIITFITGISMLYINSYLLLDTSLQLKIFLVIILSYVHGKFSKKRKELENDIRLSTVTGLKVWNEVPTCLMILIVVLIIIKPF
tara:strand:- start:136 stop:564 length:429 start_codon:yes stop_codon:yes gene_type:complete